MKLTVICMGKTKERFIQEGIAKYSGYLKHFADVGLKDCLLYTSDAADE